MKEKDEYCIKVGKNIVEARQKKKISQKELAEKLQISPTRLNYWEKGKAKPDIKMVQQIAAILDVSPSLLLGYDEFDVKFPNVKNELNQFETFISYLKSIGYEFLTSTSKDGAETEITVQNQSFKAVFTEEEFSILQGQNKELITGMILLQSQKNKKEPSSAATDNGSDE